MRPVSGTIAPGFLEREPCRLDANLPLHMPGEVRPAAAGAVVPSALRTCRGLERLAAADHGYLT